MSEKIKKQYDKIYASEEVVFGNGEPIKAVQRIRDYLDGGTVLDIGGGEGRNALYLAELGFSVSVVDISSVGIDKLKAASEQKGLDVAAYVGDVSIDGIEGSYDSIVWSFVLHHFDSEDAKRLILESKEHTNFGGVHIISTFGNKGDLYDRNTNTGKFYPDSDLLRDMYANWEVKECSVHETTTKAKNDQGDNMSNTVVTLIAVKID